MTDPTARPDLPGQVAVFADVDELYDQMSQQIMACAMPAVRDRGVFHLALSGGSSPAPLYRRLVIDPRFRLLPWHLTHVWIVDERPVPESDPASNFGMIRQNLLDHVPVPEQHLHPMPVLQNQGDLRYEQQLKQTIGDVLPAPRLDYIVLGMGDDGHTASLFPHSPALDQDRRLVVFNDGDSVMPPRPRMTMTYPLLNSARAVGILVTGKKKTDMVQQIAGRMSRHGPSPRALPVTGLAFEGPDRRVEWFMDQDAAG